MAITRFKEQASTFQYEGVTVGMRKPHTSEMEEIAKRRSAYMKTIVADIIEIRKNETGLSAEGDAVLLLELQQFISGLLCCDPNDVTNPWFAKDEAEQESLAKNGVEKDIVGDVPAEFHMTAFAKFTGTYKDPNEQEAPPTENAEDADKDPLPQRSAPQSEQSASTLISDGSSSASQSGSESTPSASENGGSTTSSTESPTLSSS